MTPLAYQIVKELTLPLKRRTFDDRARLLPRMSDVHCFELSEVKETLDSLACDIERRPGSTAVLAFLPAPKTWLEWKSEGQRFGVLLEETRFGAEFTIAGEVGFCAPAGGQIAMQETLSALRGNDKVFRFHDGYEDDRMASLPLLVYAALALINTPRVIGRRQHTPHRGLERDFVRAKKTVGKFPLHAWTEIKLAITAPRDAGCDASVEAHYTGDRALHFCRAHLRIRLGKLEIVSSHWRGDASLGIKQTRYRLTAPQRPARSAYQ